jgi:hypothetical protein
MKPEIWVSIYAAIVGTGALLLNFKNWLDSGARLFVTLIPDGMIIGGDPQFDEKDLIIVNAINRGAATTMVTNLTLHEFPSPYHRWRFDPSSNYVVLNPQLKGYPPCVPSDLEPNKKWTGVIRNRPDVVTDIHSGKFYAAVHVSHRDKPYLVHIPKRKAKAETPKSI